MGRRSKFILRAVGAFALVLVLLIVAGLGYLAFPGEPGSSRALKFEGFIMLPGHGVLNVLDYLTLSDRTLFATGTSSGSVFRIELDRGNRVTEWRGEPRPHGVALVPSRDLAFVTRSEVNAVDAFSPSSFKPLGRIRVAEDADGILYDAAHDLIYVANGDAQLATLIDPGTRTNVGTIALGGKPEFAAIDPRSGLVYQSIESANAVAAIDLGKRRVVGRWSIGSCEAPTGIAIDATLRRAFIVCGRNAMLVVFDLDKDRVVASVKIGTGPDSVAFDSSLRRIYATGISGTLTVTQQKSADSYELLDRISTHFAAHTLAVDPASHKVYLGYAGLFVAPRIAVFSPIP